MKLPIQKILIAGSIILVGITGGVVYMHHPIVTSFQRSRVINYHRAHVESTVQAQLRPLAGVLGELGFSDFNLLDTHCGYNTYHIDPDDPGLYIHSEGTFFECSSGIDRFLRIPTDTAGRQQFITHANELNAAIQSEGWHPGIDIPWFEKVSQRGNFIANNQESLKTVGQYSCTINFFTAYSDPDPPAISIQIYCGLEFKDK